MRVPFHPLLRGWTPRDLGALLQWLWCGHATRDDPFPLFDPAFYLMRYPEVRTIRTGAALDFLRRGGPETRDPHPLFDTRFYLERCPEASRSGLNPLLHFLRFGARRGCDPHPLFDTRFYREQPPPVDTHTAPNALLHYLRQGAATRRSPHPLFHPGYYLDRNPDVARAGTDPLVHYVQFGGREGRQPHPLFDPTTYLLQCPKRLPEDAIPLVHYLDEGASQGLSPHPLFDAGRYLEENEDARRSGANPLVHFVRGGTAGRANALDCRGPADRGRGGVVLAFLTLPGSPDGKREAEDASFAVLQLFSALAWDVKAWSQVPSDGSELPGPLFSGIEILTPPAWPSPQAALAGIRSVEAVLFDGGSAGSLLAPAMALHPRARRLLLLRDPQEESKLDSLAEHVDGALGDGFTPARRPGLDLRTVLEPAALPQSEARRPRSHLERRFLGFLHQVGVRPNSTLSERLTERALEAGRASATRRDVVVLSLIPWRYRYQRPQHLSVGLGRRGWRVIYVDPDFLSEFDRRAFAVEESPADHVFRVKLRMPPPSDIHAAPPDARQVAALGAALQDLARAVGFREPVLLLQAPFWLPATGAIERFLLAYDCMDLYRAFPHVKNPLVSLEDELLSRADTVVFSSAALEDQLDAAGRTVVVRNACEFERFASAAPRRLSTRPTAGYVGAVDSWFDLRLFEQCVDAHPEWDFVLVGSTVGLPRDALRQRPNLQIRGETAYEDVPSLVRGFDVCLIPFVDSALTRCVDPVKVYEYLAAGRPVVSTALPELRRLDPNLVHVARTAPDFLAGLDAAMAEVGDETLSGRRRAWAANQTWDARAVELDRALA